MNGIRAFSCLTVFLANCHHSLGMPVAGQLGVIDLARFAESGIGVAIFLVLSGALLSMPFWSALVANTRPAPWPSFALRRVVRIAPAYYACLIALFAWKGLGDVGDAATHFLFVNNLREESFYSLSPQFWTIGMFMQLYCLLPVGFRLIRGTRPHLAIALVLGGTAGAYVLHWILMASRHEWVAGPAASLFDPDGWVLSHSPLAHLPHFLLGVAAGYVLLSLSQRSTRSRGLAIGAELAFWTAALGLVVIAGVPSADVLQWPYARYWFPWMPALAAVTIVAAAFAPIAGRLLELPPVRWLGVISYGFYIYHVAAMQLVLRVSGGVPDGGLRARLPIVLAGLALTVAVATCSYLLIERPLLRWSARWSGRRESGRR